MSVSLAEALGQVDLEARQVDRCQVHGYLVELRVLEPGPDGPSSLLDESDIMFDRWVELPQPPVIATVVGRFVPAPPIDVPVIPEDGDYE